jgi:hypothetical protein
LKGFEFIENDWLIFNGTIDRMREREIGGEFMPRGTIERFK